jgi:hypothetical protein
MLLISKMNRIMARDRIQTLLKDETASNPQSVAAFLKPWYLAMLTMVKSAEAFDQGATRWPGI